MKDFEWSARALSDAGRQNPYPLMCLIARNAAGTATAATNGVIVVGEPVRLDIARQPDVVRISWPRTTADAVLERAPVLDPITGWLPATNEVYESPDGFAVELPAAAGAAFYRLRQVR